jgi:UPF0755 protein
VAQIAETFSSKLHDFNQLNFLKEAKAFEGTLFFDIYFFLSTDTEKDVINAMRKNFEKKFSPLRKDLNGFKESQVIIMASIIEKESNGDDDRVAISSILWKRIEDKMPLQVDATFLFLIGKESSELTRADLGLKSPYNTYINKGLPPGPISNPGIETLTAAMSPVKTQYLFYLHDKDGVVHYAKTFEEHKKNKQKYL